MLVIKKPLLTFFETLSETPHNAVINILIQSNPIQNNLLLCGVLGFFNMKEQQK